MADSDSFEDEVSFSGASIQTNDGDTIALTPGGRVVKTIRDVVGGHLGRYMVIEKVGSGGMGEVVRAYDPKLCREVALKRVFLRDRLAGQTKARVLEEARAMAALAHSNVVAVFDVEEIDDEIVIVMEFVLGDTLRKWQKNRTLDWRQITRVYIQAGRGLEAAHAAGLVHRDFKPANVLLGEDGRARVTDFGLARIRPNEGRPSGQGLSRETLDSDARSFTRDGLVMGSPGYMSPEAMTGNEPDAVSDLYSFCVALYEGLHGTRPFRADTMKELAAAKHKGEPTESERNRAVPAWLQRAVMKGLAPHPNRRWSSLGDLLGHLERHLDYRRRILWWGAASTVALGSIGLAFWSGQRPTQCQAGTEKVAAVWNVARAQRVGQQLQQTGVGFAAETTERVTSHLDDYARAWSDMYQEACEATHVLGEQSEHMLDLRMQCLDGRLDELGAVADVLEGADAGAVESAVVTVRAIPSLAACADKEELDSGLPPPDDPEAVRRLRREISRIRALNGTGQAEQALEEALGLQDAVEAVNYPPLVAELHLQIATQHRTLRHDAEFESWAFKTLNEARAERHHKVAAKASIALVEALRAYPDRRDELDNALLVAEAEVAAARVPGARVSILLTRGAVSFTQGRYEKAETDFRAALGIIEKDLPDATTIRTHALNHLANVRSRQGYPQEGLKLQLEALEARIETLGPNHPVVATSHQNLGGVYFAMGQVDKAESHTHECIRIRLAALAEDHPDVLVATSNLGAIQLKAGKQDAGIETLERVLKLQEKRLGPQHLQLKTLLGNLASAHRNKGNFDRSEELTERLVEIVRPLGEGHPDVARALESMAHLQSDRGDHEEALATRQKSLAQLEAAHGREHPLAVDALSSTADTLRKLERKGEAKALYLDARERLGDRTRGHSAARIHIALSELALENDNEARALEEAEAAVSIFDELKAADTNATVARFLLAKQVYETDRDRSLALLRVVVDALADVEEDSELKTDVRTWLEEHDVDVPLARGG